MVVQPVEVLWIARYDYLPGWYLDPHSHDYSQLIYILEGTGHGSLGSRLFLLERNLGILIPPHQAHSLKTDDAEAVKTLDTKFVVNDKTLREDLRRAESPMHLPGEEIRHILEQIHCEGVAQQPYFRRLCNSLLTELLVIYIRFAIASAASPASFSYTLIHSVDAKVPADPVVNEIIEYVGQHYRADCTLNEISKSTGYTAHHLSKKFKEQMGISYNQYLYKFRIAQAKELITYADFSFKQVALMMGFKDVHHFTRKFKSIEGVTPGTWRDKEHKKIRKNITLSPTFTNEDITVRDKKT